MTSLASLLRYRGDKPFAGIINIAGLNVYNKSAKPLDQKYAKQLIKTPIYNYFGELDHMQSTETAETSLDYIRRYYVKPDGVLHRNYRFTSE